jgi:magnesium-transporting ATPase (P-type)
MRLAAKILTVWFVLLAVEFTHGALRVIFLVPRVGDFPSRQIGVFTGSLLIFVVVYLFAPWFGHLETRALLAIGFVWLVLTVLFEFAMGIFLFHFPLRRILEDFNIAKGGLFPLALLFLFFSPLLVARLRRV